MMLRRGDVWDGGRAEELRLVEGTIGDNRSCVGQWRVRTQGCTTPNARYSINSAS